MTAANEPNQQRFLGAVRRALHGAPGRSTPESLFPVDPSPESRKRLEAIRNRTDADRDRLVKTLRAAAGPLNIDLYNAGGPAEAAGIIRALVAEKTPEFGPEKAVAAWGHPRIDALELERTLSVPVHRTGSDPDRESPARRQTLRKRIVESFVGVTTADFCLADTATLVLRTGPDRPRSVSLVPSIHVAVVSADRLLADLGELYGLLRWDPDQRRRGLSSCLSLITGPSKTADIEATLVHGAHGPRELHLILVGKRNFS